MTVFYCIIDNDGNRRIDLIRYLGNVICDLDLCYWLVPGTFSLED